MRLAYVGSCALALAIPASATGSASRTFDYTGSAQQFTVPAGITAITVQALGAQGSRGALIASSGAGGLGGSAIATLAVTPGETLAIFVGGRGGADPAHVESGGFNGGGNGAVVASANGGGGGGASDLRRGGTALTDRVVVAGGGGGGANTGAVPANTQGGTGGGLTGGDGASLVPADCAGKGGTQSAGGAAGTCASSGMHVFPTDGALGAGGTGGSSSAGQAGGGGGGGFYGGGGGKEYAGGGGGSGFTCPACTSPSTTNGVRSGDGQVTISFADLLAPSITISTPADGASYMRGQAVVASYACDEEAGGSGLDACTGSAANGSAIDTATAGTKQFTVTATDKDGNTATKTVGYTVVDTSPSPTPTPTPTPQPPAPKPEPLLLTCEGVGVRLVDVTPTGRRVRLGGLASRRFAGQRVVLRSGSTQVAAAVVQTDGTFTANAPAPRSGTARYTAAVGGQTSAPLRLQRRLLLGTQVATPGGVRISGRLTGGRANARALVVRRVTSCSRTPVVTARVRTDRRGRFRVTLARPTGTDELAFYRVSTAAGGKTFTLPVVVRR